jgi:hypothetical protein
MLLTPELAYQRDFLGAGMFNLGPAAALFRREAFLEVGGFQDEGPHSDWLFWLKACRQLNTLLICADLFWYRVHEGQHLQGHDAGYDAAALEWRAFEALDAVDCPLSAADRECAKKNVTGRILRAAWRDVRRRRWRLAAFRLRHARLGWRTWIMYARRPQVARMAGTPLTPDGTVLVPRALRVPPDRAARNHDSPSGAARGAALDAGWYTPSRERRAPGVVVLCYHGLQLSARVDEIPFANLHVIADTWGAPAADYTDGGRDCRGRGFKAAFTTKPGFARPAEPPLNGRGSSCSAPCRPRSSHRMAYPWPRQNAGR